MASPCVGRDCTFPKVLCWGTIKGCSLVLSIQLAVWPIACCLPRVGSKPGCKAVSRSFGKLYSKRPRALIDKGPIERLGFLSRGFSKHRQTSGNSTRPQLAQELCDGEGTLPRCSALCVPTERKGWPPPQARKLKQLCAQPCTREGALTTPSCPHHVQLLPGRLPY